MMRFTVLDRDKMFYNIKICLNVAKKGKLNAQIFKYKLQKNRLTIFVAIS